MKVLHPVLFLALFIPVATLIGGPALPAQEPLPVPPSRAESLPLVGNWPTFGNGPAHTGFFPGEICQADLAADWSLQLGNGLHQVAAGGGRVFVTFGSSFGNSLLLAALDENTGQEVWRYTFEPGFSINPPTYDSGRVYVQRGNHGSDTQLWCFDAATGLPFWIAPHGAQWEEYMAPTVADGGVWVNGGSYGGLYGFNQSDGSERFFAYLEQYDNWTPSYFGGKVYSWVQGHFRAHDPMDGTVLWSLLLSWDWSGYDMSRTVAIRDGVAYFTGQPNLYAVDLSTHQVAWTVSGTFVGTPAVSNGVIYSIRTSGSYGNTGTVNSYFSTGSYRGLYPGDLQLHDPIIVTDNALIVASESSTYIYDLASFALLKQIPKGGLISLANGRLFIAGTDGSLRAYRFANCEPTASCRSIIPEHGQYGFGDTVAITVEADTSLATQPVTLDVSVYDTDGIRVGHGSIQATLTGMSDDPETFQFPLQSSGHEGTFQVDAKVLDGENGGVESACSTTFDVMACSLVCTASVPASGVVSQPVQFQGLATPSFCQGNISYLWDFGDGSGQTSNQNPSHAFNRTGTFTWHVTAAAAGASCSEWGSILIEASACTLSCNATATPASGSSPLLVQFSPGVTTDCPGTRGYAWSFGDGQTSSAEAPAHTYYAPGTYPWSLTVSVEGKTCNRSGTVTVTPPVCAITCSALVQPDSGKAPLDVLFTASTSTANCSQVPTCTWDFGDGSSGTGGSVTHRFMIPGNYSWTLTASSGDASCYQAGTVEVKSALPGDCDGDGTVTIGDVQKVINTFLQVPGASCPAADCDSSGTVAIGEVQKAINAFLGLESVC